MLTAFGKYCRKLRIDKGELLKNMADNLGVSPAFLSAVEVGRRNVPLNWTQILKDLYFLNQEQMDSLYEAIELSKTQVKIDLGGLNGKDRQLAISFAKEFKELDDDKKNRILAMLKK